MTSMWTVFVSLIAEAGDVTVSDVTFQVKAETEHVALESVKTWLRVYQVEGVTQRISMHRR